MKRILFFALGFLMFFAVSSQAGNGRVTFPVDTTLTVGLEVTFRDSCSAIGATIKYDTSMFSISDLQPQGYFNVEPCTNFPSEGRLELAFAQLNCHQAKYNETLLLVTFKVRIKFSGVATYPRPGRVKVVNKYAKMCDKPLKGRAIDWEIVVDDLNNFLMQFRLVK